MPPLIPGVYVFILDSIICDFLHSRGHRQEDHETKDSVLAICNVRR